MKTKFITKLCACGGSFVLVLVGVGAQGLCRDADCRAKADEWATTSLLPEPGPQVPTFGTNNVAIVGTVAVTPR